MCSLWAAKNAARHDVGVLQAPELDVKGYNVDVKGYNVDVKGCTYFYRPSTSALHRSWFRPYVPSWRPYPTTLT
eukprot:4647678-Pyramimonas_sp.AAC.1